LRQRTQKSEIRIPRKIFNIETKNQNAAELENQIRRIGMSNGERPRNKAAQKKLVKLEDKKENPPPKKTRNLSVYVYSIAKKTPEKTPGEERKERRG